MIKLAEFSAIMIMKGYELFSQDFSMEIKQCKNCLKTFGGNIELFPYCSLDCASNYNHILDKE